MKNGESLLNYVQDQRRYMDGVLARIEAAKRDWRDCGPTRDETLVDFSAWDNRPVPTLGVKITEWGTDGEWLEEANRVER
jgi:hypothetical protein